MPEQSFLFSVYDVFRLSHGQLEFLGQRFKTGSVNQPPLKNRSVPFVVNVLIDQLADLAVSIFHRITSQKAPGISGGLVLIS